MEPLHLELLGTVQFRLGNEPLTGFTTMKAKALLIYLVVTQSPHTRDELAGLFWRDMPETQAKKNLRNTLPNLRALVGPYLAISRHTVALNQACPYYTDVDDFRSALAPSQAFTNFQILKDATALYRDDFLAGFYVRDAPAFEDWMAVEREHLRVMAIDGFLALAALCIDQGHYELGLAATQRLLILDPWRETGHQYRMQLLAYMGQRSAALAQYEACCKVLGDDLGVAPMEETTALYEQLKADNLPTPKRLPQTAPFLHAASVPRSTSQFKAAETHIDWSEFPKRLPCYGRQSDCQQLRQWLATESAALVGLFGLAGQGKTVLASEVVWSLIAEQPPVADSPFDYIIWRSLANAPFFTTLLKSWLTCLTDQQVEQVPDHIDEQFAMLFDYLRQYRCLLILDHFEGVLHADASVGVCRPGYEGYEQLISQIHRRVHRSSLLLISREYPTGFDTLQRDVNGFRELHLRGLSEEGALALLESCGLSGSQTTIKPLVEQYAGHPLALKLIAETVQQFFDGNLEAAIMDEPLILEELRLILEQQFETLTPPAKTLLSQLAQQPEPMPLQALWKRYRSPLEHSELLTALRALQRRSLLNIEAGTVWLPNVVTTYLTAYLHPSS